LKEDSLFVKIEVDTSRMCPLWVISNWMDRNLHCLRNVTKMFSRLMGACLMVITLLF
jgi:hypothetical protein